MSRSSSSPRRAELEARLSTWPSLRVSSTAAGWRTPSDRRRSLCEPCARRRRSAAPRPARARPSAAERLRRRQQVAVRRARADARASRLRARARRPMQRAADCDRHSEPLHARAREPRGGPAASCRRPYFSWMPRPPRAPSTMARPIAQRRGHLDARCGTFRALGAVPQRSSPLHQPTASTARSMLRQEHMRGARRSVTRLSRARCACSSASVVAENGELEHARRQRARARVRTSPRARSFAPRRDLMAAAFSPGRCGCRRKSVVDAPMSSDSTARPPARAGGRRPCPPATSPCSW